MILELDCGNSFIKWRVISRSHDVVVAGGVVDSDQQLVETLGVAPGISLTHCRLVSVRTEQETDSLAALLQSAFSIRVLRAGAAKAMAGVTNGYDDYEKLGLDRWLAVLGAWRMAQRPCVVIDFGTAVTSDFVDADGAHLGGFICPGLPLMRSQLKTHTRRIRYDEISAEKAHVTLLPGTSTVEAVERGCLLMLQGFVVTQVEQAKARWGEGYSLFLTGGDAGFVKAVAPEAKLIPDLVFHGLAIACPLD